jgi:hypothetical protein
MHRLIIILISVSFAITSLQAQDNADMKPHFTEVWTGFTVKKKMSKKFTLQLEDQVRFSENYAGVRLNFIEVGLNYHIKKGWNASANYRYSFRNSSRNTKRVSFDLSYKLKIKPVKAEIKYRARYQNTVVTYTGESLNFIRNKLTLTKRLTKKWSLYSSYELFLNMSDEYEHQANRFVFGTKIKCNKHLQLKAFAQYDQDIHGKYQPKRTVFGLVGTYNFK